MTRPPEQGFGWPTWWPTVISCAGIVALFSSHALELSEATYPIIAMMIMAGPAAYGDRWLRRRRDEEG